MIRLENISIKVGDKDFLIENVNIFITSGNLISIAGKPGSGKTKLFNILGLKEKATKGNLFFFRKKCEQAK